MWTDARNIYLGLSLLGLLVTVVYDLGSRDDRRKVPQNFMELTPHRRKKYKALYTTYDYFSPIITLNSNKRHEYACTCYLVCMATQRRRTMDDSECSVSLQYLPGNIGSIGTGQFLLEAKKEQRDPRSELCFMIRRYPSQRCTKLM